MLSKKVLELIALLNMEDGLPMVTVYVDGRMRYCVMSDDKINKLLFEIKALAEEPNNEETKAEETD